MRKIKFLAAILLLCCFAVSSVPMLAVPTDEGGDTRILHHGVTVDTDPAGGYEGDYVVIYNSSDSAYFSASTGSLAGLIETDLYADAAPAKSAEAAPVNADVPYVIDVDAREEAAAEKAQRQPREAVREDFYVGMTRNFYIANYNPAGTGNLQFKLLYQGQHCNIWTVTQAAYKPLDLINEDYARIAAEKFDSKFDLMTLSYGNFNDMNGDGRVNLMYYNIDDGWELGQGYIAGFFSKADFTTYNYLPMIHIDTYPGVQYVNAQGEVKDQFSRTFGTIVHEFQHCINYSETEGMATWLNEAFSGSAEELCFPGSGLYSRIPSWEDHRFSGDEYLYPPTEYAYNPYFGLHKGGSITSWSDAEDDIYARYALVMLFTQYLSTRYGGTEIYKHIIQANSGTTTAASYTALTEGTGWTLDSIFGGFFTSMIANDADSGYGFRMSAGYDPDEYNGIQDMYSLLAPVVYTSGSAASIYSGGFITVKPIGGVFNPPSGASSTLKYVGIKFADVGVTGISLHPAYKEMLMEQEAELTLRKEPAEANDFEVVWSSSDESVATVSGNKNGAVVTSHAFGTAVITVAVTDNSTGTVYTASSTIRVKNGYTYTRYEPTSEIRTGEPYLIGFDTGSGVYVMMNYNPNCDNSYYPNYYNYQNSYYSYGIKAVTDNGGNITGIETDVYPDALIEQVQWMFQAADSGYYKIFSCYEPSMTLCVYAAGSNYYDLYAHGSGNNNKWKYTNAGRLTYEATSSLTKYVTYVPQMGDRESVFGAYPSNSDQAAVTLYRKVTNTVILDDPEYYTVTFVDGLTGGVIASVEVEEGAAAQAPAAPEHEGYEFAGWDADFSCVTSDMTVTALYEQTVTPPAPLLGDVDCNGEVTMADVTLLAMYLNGESPVISEQGMINANANLDGGVDIRDIAAIYEIIANS